MTISLLMLITGFSLLGYLYSQSKRQHSAIANKIMTSLSYPTTPDDKVFDDEKLSIKEYVKLNPQVSSTELATLYGVSLRTAQRAIKNINLNK